MRRRFFLENLTKMLALSLLPTITVTVVFMMILLPTEKRALQMETHNNLSLIQENMDLLLNDSNKVMNLLNIPTYANSIYGILESDGLDYINFLTLRQTASQLNAIVNSRSYINSIYVYLPNSKDAYLTNSGHIYTPDDEADKDWLTVCSGEKPYRLIRRQVNLYPGIETSQDYLTVIQENSKGYVTAVNIVVSYFKRLFGSLNLKEGEIILFVDDGKILLSTSATPPDEEMEYYLEALNQPGNPVEFENMLVSHSHSSTTGLDFVSVTPKKVLYSSVYRLMVTAFITMSVCIVVSVLASIRYTSNVSRQLYSVVDLLEAAIANQPLPQIKNTDNSLYSHIITNIIQTFTQNDFLKVSLNEQKFRALSLELSALQYQINPHFLSNTLQMIDFEVLRIAKKPTPANQMIQKLSQFLQYSLCSPDSDVTLEQELEATKYYTALMEFRYDDQVAFCWDADPEVLSQPVPKLILQPVIENSIKHGMKEDEDTLHISVSAYRSEDGDFNLVVRDDGAGLQPEKLEELRASLSDFRGFQEQHIGLQNLFRRLQIRFSGEQCSIFLNSESGENFVLRIVIREPSENYCKL